MIEHFFTCPHCWQTISMLLDSSISNQTFIEDCEVCCNPLTILVSFENEEISIFEVQITQ